MFYEHNFIAKCNLSANLYYELMKIYYKIRFRSLLYLLITPWALRKQRKMMLFPSALVSLMAMNKEILSQENSLALAKSPFTLCEAKCVYGDTGLLICT